MFDDSPNDKPNGSMLFGPQFLATKLYQLSPPEVCCLMLINMLNVKHTKNAYKLQLLFFIVIAKILLNSM